jgi:hypothetical protein
MFGPSSALNITDNRVVTLDGFGTTACNDYNAVCAYKSCAQITTESNCLNVDAATCNSNTICNDTALYAGFTRATQCGPQCGTCPTGIFSRTNAVLDFCNRINPEYCVFQNTSFGATPTEGCSSFIEKQTITDQLAAAKVTCGSPPDGKVMNATGFAVDLSNVTVTAPKCCATLTASDGFCQTIAKSESSCMKIEAMAFCNTHAFNSNVGCAYYDHDEFAFRDLARQADCLMEGGTANGGVAQVDLDCDGDMDIVTATKTGHFLVHRCDSTGSSACTYVRDLTTFTSLSDKTFEPAVKVNSLTFDAVGHMNIEAVYMTTPVAGAAEKQAGGVKTVALTFINSVTAPAGSACARKGSTFTQAGPSYGTVTPGVFAASDLVADMAVAITAFVGGDSSEGLNATAWSEKFGTGIFLDASPNSKMQPWRTVAAAGPTVTLMNTIQTYLNKLYCNFPDSAQPAAYTAADLTSADSIANNFLFNLVNLTYSNASAGCDCELSDDGQWVPTAKQCTARRRMASEDKPTEAQHPRNIALQKSPLSALAAAGTPFHHRQLKLYDPQTFFSIDDEHLTAGSTANKKPTDALFTQPDYKYIDQCMKTALLDVVPEDGASCKAYFGASSMRESLEETVLGQPNMGVNNAWSYTDVGGFDFGNNVARFLDPGQNSLRLCAADGTCSPFATEGRVEILHDAADGNGPRWGTVCADGVDSIGTAQQFAKPEADAICKQLGFVGAFDDGFGPVDAWDEAFSFKAKGYGKKLAGAAEGSQVWLDDLTCGGSSEHIDSCTRTRGWGEHAATCTHAKDAAVSCIPRNNAIRLCGAGSAANGGSACSHAATSGRVEVFPTTGTCPPMMVRGAPSAQSVSGTTMRPWRRAASWATPKCSAGVAMPAQQLSERTPSGRLTRQPGLGKAVGLLERSALSRCGWPT